MNKRTGVTTFGGNPVTLLGPELKVGDKAPDFTLTAADLSKVTLNDSKGKYRIILSALSVHTGVCSKEAHEFNKRIADMGDDVVVYMITKDLPFTLKNFCAAENIDNVVILSAYHDDKFAEDYGVLIENLLFLARGAFVVDPSGKIIYAKINSEVGTEPDYDKVLAALPVKA